MNKIVRFDLSVLRELGDHKTAFYWRDTRPMDMIGPSLSTTDVTPLLGLGMIGIRDERGSYYAPNVVACVDFFEMNQDGSILCAVQFESQGQTDHVEFERRYQQGSLEYVEVRRLVAIVREYLNDESAQKQNEYDRATGGLNLARLLYPEFIAPTWIPGRRS